MSLFIVSSLFAVSSSAANASTPIATVANGTYQGRYLSEWDQDVFLGIPYAQPPIGPLRFRWPQSLNSSFTGVKSAEQYGYSCYQYGTTFNLSEDCLNLNGKTMTLSNGETYSCSSVIRPQGYTSNDSLPVLVWVFGGGLYTGSTAGQCSHFYQSI